VSVDYDTGEFALTADALPGVPIRITKYATYQASRNIPVRELVDRCGRTLDRTVRDGFDALVTKQREHLDRFWDRADVRAESKTSPCGCSKPSGGTLPGRAGVVAGRGAGTRRRS
jgi:alpha,alpha-trehalose phosphorylase